MLKVTEDNVTLLTVTLRMITVGRVTLGSVMLRRSPTRNVTALNMTMGLEWGAINKSGLRKWYFKGCNSRKDMKNDIRKCTSNMLTLGNLTLGSGAAFDERVQ